MTGQYSRLGTLLDPLTDRALVLSGAIVCWKFELLPRWALAVLAVRELAIMMLVRYGLRRGADIKINWPGRWAVWPLMSALFFAIVGLDEVAQPALYVGLALSIWSLVLYLQDGRRQLSSQG
jgi:cardiolipin synthase